MPIYEYLCESCGKVNERLQKVGDPAPSRCEECGARKLAKLVSRSAFQLKGGGWYSDLYASRKPEPAAAEGSAATPAAETGKTEKADKDAKPEKGAKAENPAPAKTTPAPGAAAPKAGKKGGRKGGR